MDRWRRQPLPRQLVDILADLLPRNVRHELLTDLSEPMCTWRGALHYPPIQTREDDLQALFARRDFHKWSKDRKPSAEHGERGFFRVEQANPS